MFFLIVIPSLPDDDELLLPGLSDIQTMHHPVEMDHPVAQTAANTFGITLEYCLVVIITLVMAANIFKSVIKTFGNVCLSWTNIRNHHQVHHCEFIEHGLGKFSGSLQRV